MKIGVLTYHRVINIGATLQAFCVSEFFKSLGHDVFLIDLRNLKTEFQELRKIFSIKKLSINFDQLSRIKNQRLFLKKNFNLTKKIFSGNLNKFSKKLIDLNLDLISVGSDTVWELRPNGYSALTVNEYFLPHYNKPKISFSASMDPINQQLKYYKSLMSKRSAALKNFDKIFVRDSSTQKALNQFNINSIITADPTIIMMNHKIFKNVSAEPKKLIGVQLNKLGYNIMSKNIPYDLIDVTGNSSSIGLKFSPKLTVEEYLFELSKIKILITNRFHGVLLTMIVSNCSTPIIAYEDPEKWQSNSSKLRDLFDELNIPNFLVKNYNQIPNLINNIEKNKIKWPNFELKNKLQFLSYYSSLNIQNYLKKFNS